MIPASLLGKGSDRVPIIERCIRTLLQDLTKLSSSLAKDGAHVREALKGYSKGLDDDSLLRYYDNPAWPELV